MTRSSIRMASFAGVVLVVALITGVAVHVHGASAPVSKTVATRVVATALKRARVPTATPTPARVPAVPAVAAERATATAPVPEITPSATSTTPSATPGGTAWITLDINAAVPGSRTVPLHGGGFTSGETVDVRVDGGGSSTHAKLTADAEGGLDGSVPLQIAPGDGGTLHLLATGERSGLQATATIGVVPYVAMLSLVPYAAVPGQSVDVSGQGYPPNVPVRLQVGGKVIQTVRTDGGGNLQIHAAFTVPYTAAAGRLLITATSTSGHIGAWQNLDVLALKPWAIASTYAVRVGDRVQFDAHGFAAGEPVKVYVGDSYVGQSNGPTDGQGNAGGLGPFTVPSNDPQPTYAFVGARSGARVDVTLSVVG